MALSLTATLILTMTSGHPWGLYVASGSAALWFFADAGILYLDQRGTKR